MKNTVYFNNKHDFTEDSYTRKRGKQDKYSEHYYVVLREGRVVKPFVENKGKYSKKSIVLEQWLDKPNIEKKIFPAILNTGEAIYGIVGETTSQAIYNYSVKEPTSKLPESIENVIKEAQVLLTYDFDWDENEGEPTDSYTLEKATHFLELYSSKLLNEQKILEVPTIDIMPDGSISMKWDTKTAQFFIIFKKGDFKFSYYYGEKKDENLPSKIKDGIENFGSINPILLIWMKEYLSE